MQSLHLQSRRAICTTCDETLLRSFISVICGTESRATNRRQPFLLSRQGYHNGSIINSSGVDIARRSLHPSAPRQSHEQRRALCASGSCQAGKSHEQEAVMEQDDVAELLQNSNESSLASQRASEGQAQSMVQPASETSSVGLSAEDASTSGTNETSVNFVPWYLQQSDAPARPSQPVAAGQDLPAMPDHAPELLEPIAKHTLETLGITHLSVVDLRQMTDPPPALGANLIMVVGTARSERHLHASADKLCRWIRTEYKLTPFADGLLGRNEMKIAVRRRARRAKMMAAVGNKTVDDGDIADGLRSGWICVNVGRIKGGVLPEHAEGKQDIIGFGTTNDSTTLVVQMMTEEKREELNLEELWSRALAKQIRAREEMIRLAEESSASQAAGEGVSVPLGDDHIVTEASSHDTAYYRPTQAQTI